MEIGKKIQQLRREKNLTQEQAAAALGVTSAAVSKWETGAAVPDVAMLCPLARLLGTTVDELLDFRPALEQEEYDKALALLDEEPEVKVNVRTMRANILLRKGGLDEAEKLYQTELWLAGREAALNLVGLYNAACRQEDWARAMECIDTALAMERVLHTEELGGLTTSLHMLRGEVLLRQGRPEEAMEGLSAYVDQSLAQWARLNGGGDGPQRVL